METLHMDIDLCLSDDGREGPTRKKLDEFAPTLDSALDAVLASRGKGMTGWLDLPQQDPQPYLDFARENAGRYESMLAIGIGGSALGITALSTALLPFYYNELSDKDRQGRPRLYVLDNVDPDETHALLARLDLRRTLVNVISKSGTTGESMASYLIAREHIEEAVGSSHIGEHLVFTTDPSTGALRKIGEALGVCMFDLPSDVGGRFSVLTPVGLLPGAMTGMDIEGLLDGARAMADHVSTVRGWENPACAYGGLHYLHDTEFGRRVSVMTPYAAGLRDVADWYRQLWAESLGKEVDRRGRVVHVGPLPVKGLGVTDQHSQLQLYAEGPDDKLFVFVGVRRFEHAVGIPEPGPEAQSLAYLGGRDLADLMSAEQRGTTWALKQKGRPSLTITLPRIDAYSVGGLLYLLQMATAIAGELYDVDAFNQPGVELSKQATYALMGREGFERLAHEMGQ